MAWFSGGKDFKRDPKKTEADVRAAGRRDAIRPPRSDKVATKNWKRLQKGK
jgi:hypothetical protein